MSYISSYPPAVIEVLLVSPAGFPPSYTTAAASAAENLYVSNTIALVFALSISTLALAFRLYTKLVLIKQWNLEDFLLVPAWILLLYYSAESQLAVQDGAGRHMWNITLGQFYSSLYHISITTILYCVIVVLLKVAILMQYIRIFVPTRNGTKGLRYTIYVAIGLNVLFYGIITFCTIFICFPREAYYNPYVKGNCLNWQALAEVVAIFTVISDFALLIIPIFPVYKLHIARKKKIMIGLFFAIGLIDCIASIIRAYYTWYLINSSDISWNTVFMGTWAWIEMAFGIVVVCLPVSPRLYKHLRERSSALMTSSWRRFSRAPEMGRDESSSDTNHLDSSRYSRPHFSSFHRDTEKEDDIARPQKTFLTKESYEFEDLSDVR